MCNFASFILTKNNEYYLKNSDGYYNMNIHEESDVVKVKFIKPQDFEDIQDANKWQLVVEQEEYPYWTYENDPMLEYNAREILSKNIKEQKFGACIEKGIWRKVVVGDYGKAIVGYHGTAIAGSHGIADSGKKGKSIAGRFGTAVSGDYGKSFVCDQGTAISGYKGKSDAGLYGIAIAGDYGKSMASLGGIAKAGNHGEACAGSDGTTVVKDYGIATVGSGGKAKAGKGGQLKIYYMYNDWYKLLIGKIGENGLEPNIFYKVKNCEFVRAE